MKMAIYCQEILFTTHLNSYQCSRYILCIAIPFVLRVNLLLSQTFVFCDKCPLKKQRLKILKKDCLRSLQTASEKSLFVKMSSDFM